MLQETIQRLAGEDLEIDYVVDRLVTLACLNTRLRAMAASDSLEITIQENERHHFYFNDAVGRLRMVLARLYIRCSESYPLFLEGTLYGFESRLTLRLGANEDVPVFVKTENKAGFPELIIEVPSEIVGDM